MMNAALRIFEAASADTECSGSQRRVKRCHRLGRTGVRVHIPEADLGCCQQLCESGGLIELLEGLLCHGVQPADTPFSVPPEFQDCRSYSLLTTGHSLGAGTAALLAMLLRRNTHFGHNVRCLAYSPPGGLLRKHIGIWHAIPHVIPPGIALAFSAADVLARSSHGFPSGRRRCRYLRH
jgi:hypothetical protein